MAYEIWNKIKLVAWLITVLNGFDPRKGLFKGRFPEYHKQYNVV